MEEIGIAVAGKAAELSVVPIGKSIGKHICYPFKCQSNIDCLKKQVEKLEDLRDRVKHEVDEAERQGDGIENDVLKWRNSVDEFIQGVKKTIIEDEENAKKRCFIGLCPNLMMRYSLSKKAANKTKDGVVLFEEGKFDKVSYRQPLQKIPSSYSRGYDEFDSRKENFNDLMEALRNSDVNLIGVCGMGGVGKTTLVKKVAAQALEEQLFDVVVMVEVTETTPDIENIQGQIADKLGLKFHEESVQGRAGRLCERLKKEKKVLIVLDNIWKKLDLEAVGIPSREEENKRSSLQADTKAKNDEQRRSLPADPKGKNDEQRRSLQADPKAKNDEQRQSLQADPKGKNDELWRCKILLTSRKLHVLRDGMNIQKNVQVRILSPEEAKNFFWNIVADSKKKNDFDNYAVEIVKYCAGLPVAIATIANALKNRSSNDDWKHASDQLSQYCGRHNIGLDANVYSPIKLSYDFLEIAEAKSLFLLCSLFNASCNISIVDLLKYGTALRLFQDVRTLEQRRNKLHTLINNLKDSCLLLEGNTDDDVKMHDIIHDVAVSIASEDELMFNVRDVTELEEMLEEKLDKNSTAISLPYKDVSVLPQRLEYSKLRLLFLFMDEFSLQIPNSFFEGIKKLEVLNLTKIRMLSLPPSLGWLTNLQTLCLDQCQLRNIAIIGELKRLEILCFRGSDIEHLPKQIGQLNRLRLLELSNCSTLKVISPNVISSLTRLEELYMGNSFNQWEVEGQSNASLSELKQLSGLTTLEIHVLDAQIMPQDLMIFEKLERYRIVFGDEWNWSDDYESSRRLKLKLINSIVLGNGVKILLNRTEDLYLDKLTGVKNVLYELNGEGFPQLKHLHVQNGHEIQCIVNSIQRGLCNVFPKLESLFLRNLINLEMLFNGQLTTGSLSKLRILKIGKCDRLTHLFSFSMTRNLLQLEEIEVTDCKKLEEIVFNNSDEQFHQNGRVNRTEFTRLRTLRLQCLPQLTSFGLNAFTPEIGSQEILAEDELGGFMPNVLIPNLENLKLSSINIECLWLDQLPARSSCCQTLTSLTLEECSGNLKFLFSYSVVQSLVRLQKLEVRNCKSIEEIINTEELRGEKKMIKMVFPQLINLQLKGLPKLSRFGSGNSVEFLSLTQISIQDCPKLKTFFSDYKYVDIKKSKEVEEMNFQDDIHLLFDEKVVLPNLASMNLSSILIQTIWHNQLQPMSPCFQNLKEIIMDGCDTVKYGLPSSMVESLVQLQVLEISNCKLMEVVTITAGERINNTLFTKLHRLRLKHLPELTTFCNFAGKLIELTSLAQLWLENCPKMHAFVSNSPRADMPAAKEEHMNSEKNLQYSHIQPFFDEKVQLPTLASLYLSAIASQTISWHNQLQPHSAGFHNLSMFTVDNCDNLKYLFPFSVAESLDNLEVLLICNCKLLEGVIITQGERKSSTPFPKLKQLRLGSLPELTRFCNFNGNPIELPSLSELGILNCPKMQTFAFDSLPSIEETEEVNTETEENLPSFFDEKVQLPTLASLELSSIASQTISWHNQLQAHSACFHNLTKLTIQLCHNLKYLFPFSVAESLDNLEVLDIKCCELLEGVIITQGERKSSTLFPKLKQLYLSYLPELTRFYTFNGYSIELPSLSELNIHNCPKMQTFASDSLPGIEETEEVNTETEENLPSFFDEKVSFSCLKKLELSYLPELLHLWKENSQPRKVFENLAYLEVSGCDNLKTLVPSSVSLQNLETLEVRNCDGLISLVTFSTAKSLKQLKRMEIIDCKLVEEIIIDRGDEIKDVIVFNQLEYLKLQDLPSLTSFCKGSFTIEFSYLQRVLVIGYLKMMNFSQGVLSTPKLQSLQMTESSDEGCWEGDLNTTIQKLFRDGVGLRYIENFTVSNFPHLKEVWHEKFLASYFSNLKSLVVDDKCFSVRYIFTPSVALGLVQLQELEIKNCAILEVITVTGEETISNTMFPNLNSLKLINLQNLTCFCNFAGNSIELPSLTQLWIENCPNMETFISNFLGVDMSTSKDNCHTDIQPLFDEKVGLPNLELLLLDKMDKLKKIWHHQLSSDSFCKLDYFGLHDCHNVLNVIPSNMLGRLQKLHELGLTNCSSLCEIFELQASGCGKTQAITATQLEKLWLSDLPKLKHIWDVDSQGLLTCQNLISIQVTGCGSLKSIFPASVGRNLLQLEELCIENCCMVEEIFAKEEQVDEVVPRFPQLTLLRLAELSRLRSFYPRVHISEWPMLKELQVWNCDKVELSASNFLSFKVTHEMPLDQPLLLLDKVPLTNMESLGLDWKWFEKEALHENLPEYSCKLNFLSIKGFHKRADICVFCFLHKLPNLEKLEVSGGFFKGLFLCEGFGCEEKHVEAPTKLSHLRLLKLNDSLHLWEENSLSSKGFQNLAILEVDCCSNIKSLVPSSVSFQNLTRLKVLKCNKLLNLVAIPTAKSLVQLTRLSISECKMVEEIIIHEGDEVKDRIIFKKLRNLDLKCLPSLTSFYPGSCTTVFPNLQQVVVSGCPNMKIFSRGVLSTPRLHKLQTTEDKGKGFWKGNLNTTIEHLFIENGQSSTEN